MQHTLHLLPLTFYHSSLSVTIIYHHLKSPLFAILQHPAAHTGHLSAAHSTLQITAELDFIREVLSLLLIPPRLEFAHVHASSASVRHQWVAFVFVHIKCLERKAAQREKNCIPWLGIPCEKV